MTPTLTQRLWLAPVSLPPDERWRLVAARAAFILFVVQPTLGLAATATTNTIDGIVVGATVVSYLLAILILGFYERLPTLVKALAATAGALVISSFVYSQPGGEVFVLLYVGLVFYVSFFFSRRRAIVQVALVVLLATASTRTAASVGEIVRLSILNAGTLAGAAGITLVLRRQLRGALVNAIASRATLDAFFEHAAGGFAFLDSDLRFVRVNDPLASMIELPVERIVGRSVREIFPHQADAVESLLRAILATGEPVVGIELASADGRRDYLVDYYPVAETLKIGMSVADVTRLKHSERSLTESNRQLTVLATTDELTELPNRRSFSEQLSLALARARKSGSAVALLSIDLDRFKDVNDSLGHAYGDRLLAEVARLLREAARENDVVARIGGDEFVVLLAELDLREAPRLTQTVAERIQALLSAPISIGPVELRADASIGSAIYPRDAHDEDGLLGAADAAMYRRKTATVRVA
ncbi:MAG: GGDEF domain-containing protein [Gaiellaceae bacterium MAG52_C11]|nr:GGDEF domain-containing protein [Candidatus Gaiellasilicea maunaloa]